MRKWRLARLGAVKPRMKFRYETELAACVVAWLTDLHWDVYQEVKRGGPIADIVAVQGKLLWVIECKRSACLDVLVQALNWKPMAHFVSVAIPKSSGGFDMIAEYFGLGVLSVATPYGSQTLAGFVNEQRRPAFFRQAVTNKWKLDEHQKTVCAAGSSGGYWTPFKATCESVRECLRRHGAPVPAKQLIAEIKHHYRTASTARNCLITWARAGKIPGVALDETDSIKFKLT